MQVVLEQGLDGAARARGVAIVIDVLRAFTVSAYALGGGAVECVLVRTVEEAFALRTRLPGAVLSAEVGGRPVEGIPISNSPTLVVAADLRGRALVQRTSAGTQAAAAAAAAAERVFVASLVVATATADAVRRLEPDLVTLVASGWNQEMVEDGACAELLADLLQGRPADPVATARRVRESERVRDLVRSAPPGFPLSDLDLALDADRFDFAMPLRAEEGLLRVRAASPSSP